MIMQNLICVDKLYIKRIFDLKGSQVGRKTKNVENVDKMKALKEEEFIWMKNLNKNVLFLI